MELIRGGVPIRRIARTSFPGKFSKKGSLRYIAVPNSVEERMGLKEGDYLDVVISWPITEEYEIDDRVEGNNTENE